jgi:hypothetical protein
MTNAPIGPSNAVPKTKFMPAHRGTKSASPSSPLSKGRSSARADSRRVFCDGGVHCTGLAHPRTHFSVKPFVEYLQGRRAAGSKGQKFHRIIALALPLPLAPRSFNAPSRRDAAARSG